MSPGEGLIGVTGATGAVGGRVASRLAQAGLAQKLVVRDSGRAPRLPGAEVAQASYEDAAAMRLALSGVRTLFLVSGKEAFRRVEQHVTAVDAAVAAGVERIVYLSFLAAAPDATFTFARDHFHTEEHARATGLSHAFLRPSLYADLVPHWCGTDGIIRGPAGEGRVAWVARDDLADAATAVLVGEDGEHDGRTYDVTGPEALTLAETAEVLSGATGRRIRYEEETPEEARASRAPSGAPDWEIEGWATSYAAIATGEMDVVSDAVRNLAGHEPLSLPAYLQRHPESYRHLVSA